MPNTPSGRPRVSIYCRTSDRKSGATSLTDQEKACRIAAEEAGWEVASVHVDRHKSGYAQAGRHGLSNLLAEAEVPLIQFIMVYSLDRLSRNQQHFQEIRKRLEPHGVTVVEARGPVQRAGYALGAFRAEDEREILISRSAAGRRIMVENGLVPHDCSYGYVRDTRKRGRHVPHPERASVVQTIFRRAAAGVSDGEIAADIDSPTPRDCQAIDRGRRPSGAKWTAKLVARLKSKAIYRGVLINGRTTLVRDPDTEDVIGYADVPEAEWNCVRVPRMQIVEDDLWNAAQKTVGSAFGKKRSVYNQRLLSKVVRCGTCAKPMDIRNVTTGRIPTEWTCRTPDCAGCGSPPIAEVDRAVLAVVGRFLDGILADKTAVGHASSALDEAMQEGLIAERDRIELRLESEIAGVLVTDRKTLARRAADELRLRVIAGVLYPRADDGTTIDLPGTQAAIVAAIAEPADVILGSRMKTLFEGVRRLCHRVDVNRTAVGGWHLAIALDPTGVGSFVSSQAPCTLEAVVNPQARSAGHASPESTRLWSSIALREGARLPSAVSSALEGVSAPLATTLAAIGWSVASVIEAEAFKRSTSADATPDAFGNVDKFAAARILIRDSGMRGPMKRHLVHEAIAFQEAFNSLFYRKDHYSRWAPLIEAALDVEIVSAFRARAGGLHVQDGERLLRLAEWLDRARVFGLAMGYLYSDVQLTVDLLHLGEFGIERFFTEPKSDAELLARRLKEVEHDFTGRELVTLDHVINHLQEISPGGDPTSTQARIHAVKRFRAAGVAGIHTLERTPRLTVEHEQELVELLQGGVDPRDPTRSMSTVVLRELLAERFGIYQEPGGILRALHRQNVRIREAGLQVPKGMARLHADIVTSMVFEGG